MTKTKSTKRALVLSALSVLVCVSMLVGSTFAWFTDSVTSAKNVIMSGNLDVDLVDAAGNSLAGEVLEFVDLDDNDLWEPGCTYTLEDVYVVNKGNLALKYDIAINGVDGDAKLLEAIEWTVTVDGQTADFANLKGSLLAGEKTGTIKITGHMKEDAGNEYQGLTAEGISISVFATQYTYESDSFDNQYDANAPWTGTVDTAWYNANETEFTLISAEQLAGLAQLVNTGTDFAGKTVKLGRSIDLNNIAWTPIGDPNLDVFVGFKGTFDGQNNTISNLSINSDAWGMGLFGYITSNVTIKNVNVNNVNVKASDCCGAIVGYATYGTFSNIAITGNVQVYGTAADGHVGGIAGCGYNASFDNCSVIADANSSIYSAGSFVGGIVGYQCNYTKAFTNCQVEGLSITGRAAIGGISGIMHAGGTLTGCSVENVVLTKTSADGKPSIGALVGNYTGSAETNLTNNVANNVSLNGSAVAFSAFNVLYGSNYSNAAPTATFDTTGTTANVVNNLVTVETIANAAQLKDAIANGGNFVLTADIAADANTAITVASGKTVSIDLNGHEISATANKSGNQELFLVKGNLTVKNGSVALTAENNQGWSSMATIFDVTAGGVLNMENVTANVGGTDMNFIVHLNNWGSATLNVNNCDFTATYVAIRAFNSGYDMNNVTVENTAFHGGRVFWVHNYTSEGKDDSTLNLDIYGNNNTTDNAKPVRFGFSNEIYFDIAGNPIA